MNQRNRGPITLMSEMTGAAPSHTIFAVGLFVALGLCLAGCGDSSDNDASVVDPPNPPRSRGRE